VFLFKQLPENQLTVKFRSSLFKGLRVKGRALAVSKGGAFGGIFKGETLKLKE